MASTVTINKDLLKEYSPKGLYFWDQYAQGATDFLISGNLASTYVGYTYVNFCFDGSSSTEIDPAAKKLTLSVDDGARYSTMKAYSNGLKYYKDEESSTVYAHDLTVNGVAIGTIYGGAVMTSYKNRMSISTKDTGIGVTSVGDVAIEVNSATVGTVYGAGAGMGSVHEGDVSIYLNDAKVSTVYGGGSNKAVLNGNVTITLQGDAAKKVSKVYAGGNNTTVNGDALVTFTEGAVDTFKGTLIGKGYGTSSKLTGESTLLLKNATGDFNGTVKNFNTLELRGTTAVTFTKGQDSSMKNAEYKFAITDETTGITGAEAAMLTWNKSVKYNNVTVSLEMVDLAMSEDILLISSNQFTKDTTVDLANFQIINAEGNKVYGGLYSLAYEKYNKKEKSGGTVTLSYNEDALTITEDTTLAEDFVTTSLDETMILAADTKLAGNVDLSKGDDTLLAEGTLDGFVTMGEGDDTIVMKAGSTLTGTVAMGDGNDTLTFAEGSTATIIASMGDGNDALDIATGAEVNCIFDMGNGIDSVTIAAGCTVDGTINLGEGENTIYVEGPISHTLRFNGGEEEGTTNTVVVAENKNVVLSYAQFSNIEQFHFVVNSGASLSIDFRAYDVSEDIVQTVQSNIKAPEDAFVLVQFTRSDEFFADSYAVVDMDTLNPQIITAFGLDKAPKYAFAQKGTHTVTGTDGADVVLLKNGAEFDEGSSIALGEGADSLALGNEEGGEKDGATINGTVDMGDDFDIVTVYADSQVTGSIKNVEQIVLKNNATLTADVYTETESSVGVFGEGSIVGNIYGNVNLNGSLAYEGTIEGKLTGVGAADVFTVDTDVSVTKGIDSVGNISIAEEKILRAAISGENVKVTGNGVIDGDVTITNLTGEGNLNIWDSELSVANVTDFENITLKNASGALGNVTGTGTFDASQTDNTLASIGSLEGFETAKVYVTRSEVFEAGELAGYNNVVTINSLDVDRITLTVDGRDYTLAPVEEEEGSAVSLTVNGTVNTNYLCLCDDYGRYDGQEESAAEAVFSGTITGKDSLTVKSEIYTEISGTVEGTENEDRLCFTQGGILVLGDGKSGLLLGKEGGMDTIEVANAKTLYLYKSADYIQNYDATENLDEIVAAFKESGVDVIEGDGTIIIGANYEGVDFNEDLRNVLKTCEIEVGEGIKFEAEPANKYTKLYQINARDRSSLVGTSGNDWMEFNTGKDNTYIKGKLKTSTGDDIISFDNKEYGAAEDSAVTYQFDLVKNGEDAVDLGDGINIISTYSYDNSGSDITNNSIKKVTPAPEVTDSGVVETEDGKVGSYILYSAVNPELCNTVELVSKTFADSDALAAEMKKMNVTDYFGNFTVTTGNGRKVTLHEEAQSYEAEIEGRKEGDIVFVEGLDVTTDNKVVYADVDGTFTLSAGKATNLIGYDKVGCSEKGFVSSENQNYASVDFKTGIVTTNTLSGLDGFTGKVTTGAATGASTVTAKSATATFSDYKIVSSLTEGEVSFSNSSAPEYNGFSSVTFGEDDEKNIVNGVITKAAVTEAGAYVVYAKDVTVVTNFTGTLYKDGDETKYLTVENVTMTGDKENKTVTLTSGTISGLNSTQLEKIQDGAVTPNYVELDDAAEDKFSSARINDNDMLCTTVVNDGKCNFAINGSASLTDGTITVTGVNDKLEVSISENSGNVVTVCSSTRAIVECEQAFTLEWSDANDHMYIKSAGGTLDASYEGYDTDTLSLYGTENVISEISGAEEDFKAVSFVNDGDNGVEVTFKDATTKAITGSAKSDTLTLDSSSEFGAIDLGEGTDTLVLEQAAVVKSLAGVETIMFAEEFDGGDLTTSAAQSYGGVKLVADWMEEDDTITLYSAGEPWSNLNVAFNGSSTFAIGDTELVWNAEQNAFLSTGAAVKVTAEFDYTSTTFNDTILLTCRTNS